MTMAFAPQVAVLAALAATPAPAIWNEQPRMLWRCPQADAESAYIHAQTAPSGLKLAAMISPQLASTKPGGATSRSLGVPSTALSCTMPKFHQLGFKAVSNEWFAVMLPR